MITIGDQQLATNVPADLNARLIATTGCSAVEHAHMIRRLQVPAAIARVLAPMLETPIEQTELAALIEAADPVVIAAAVVALLAPAGPGEPAALAREG